MNAAKDILVIEDDSEIREMLEERLVREGFKVKTAEDGKKGFEQACLTKPSLILLDLMLPEMRGMEVCKNLKELPETKAIPIIMLTANSDEVDIILGLEMGADDYVIKPFNFRQLIARIRAVLRRGTIDPNATNDSMRMVGPIAIDVPGREVRIDNKRIPLTHAEFELLDFLSSKAGEVVTRAELLKSISSEDDSLIERNIDVHIGSLRKKLGPHGNCIVTVRSLGYKCVRTEQTG